MNEPGASGHDAVQSCGGSRQQRQRNERGCQAVTTQEPPRRDYQGHVAARKHQLKYRSILPVENDLAVEIRTERLPWWPECETEGSFGRGEQQRLITDDGRIVPDGNGLRRARSRPAAHRF